MVPCISCVDLKPLRPVLLVGIRCGVSPSKRERRLATRLASRRQLRAKKCHQKPPDAETSLVSRWDINILSLHATLMHTNEARRGQSGNLRANLWPFRRRGKLDEGSLDVIPNRHERTNLIGPAITKGLFKIVSHYGCREQDLSLPDPRPRRPHNTNFKQLFLRERDGWKKMLSTLHRRYHEEGEEESQPANSQPS